MRNCGFIYKEGENKFRTYLGKYKLLNCPISVITDYSNYIISQYSAHKNLNTFGGTFDIDSRRNKDIESLLTVNSIVDDYEKDKTDQIQQRSLREAKRNRGQRH